MNTTQRKIVLIVSIILAPIFFLWGAFGADSPMGIVAPIVSVGIGIWVWSGRDK